MRILHTKDDSVTRGVLDKDVHVEHDLREVTYVDHNGTPHTVFAHREGPFQTPESIVEAHQNGTLHTHRENPDVPLEPPPPAGVVAH